MSFILSFVDFSGAPMQGRPQGSTAEEVSVFLAPIPLVVVSPVCLISDIPVYIDLSEKLSLGREFVLVS